MPDKALPVFYVIWGVVVMFVAGVKAPCSASCNRQSLIVLQMCCGSCTPCLKVEKMQPRPKGNTKATSRLEEPF
jgi:hypothetical protein